MPHALPFLVFTVAGWLNRHQEEQAHWEGLAAADLFTVEVLTLEGLKRYLVLFAIELKTRYAHIAGIHPQSHWVRATSDASSTSTSSITTGRETIRGATTSFSSEHRRPAWMPPFDGGSVSEDCSVSTIERLHERSAD